MHPQRLVLIAVFALVLSCPYAIPVFWLSLSRWLNVVSGDNPGFLPSPVVNQVWYMVFGSIAVFLTAAVASLRKQLPPVDRFVAFAGISWFAVTGMRGVFTPGIQWSYGEVLLQAGFLFLFLTALLGGPQRGDIVRLQGLAAFAVIPVSVLALFQNAGFDPLPYSTTLPGSLEIVQGKQLISSTFGHPNYMGSYLAPVILLCVALTLGRVSPVLRVVGAIAALLAVMALILGGTRGPLLALAAGLLVFFLMLPSRAVSWQRTALFTGIGFALVIITAALTPALRPNFDVADRLFGSKEIASRAFYWRVGVSAFLQNPLVGIGPGQFDRLFWQYVLEAPGVRPGEQWHFVLANIIRGVRPGQMHNDHLQVLVETGILGAAAWTALWVSLARRGFRLGRPQLFPAERRTHAMFMGVMAVFFVDALFSFPFHLPCSGALFWCLVGLWTSLKPEESALTAPNSD